MFQTFARFDEDNSGDVDKREFRRAMEHLRIEVSSSDIEAIFARYDRSDKGSIDYSEFLELMHFTPSHATPYSSSSSGEDRDSHIKRIIVKIRQKMEDNLGNDAQSSQVNTY